MSNVTQILERVEQGDSKAADELLPLVYEELRRLAAHWMANEAAGHTLQPTALVHEAWMRLVGSNGPAQFQNRAHFFAAAAEAMRRILIDRARRNRAVRHGGGQQRVDIQEVDLASTTEDDQLLAVSEALDKLATQHKVEAELVKLRYFVGMTNDEAAEVLGISPRTAKYYWAHARAWLFHAINSRDVQGTKNPGSQLPDFRPDQPHRKYHSSALYFENRKAQARFLNENSFSSNCAAAAKPFAVSRGMGRLLVGLLFTACSVFFVARGESVHSISGWVQPADAPYNRYGQFVVLADPLDKVRAILYDPQHLLTAAVPARLRLLVTITQTRGPDDEPVFRVTHAEAGSSSSDSEAANGTGTPPWSDLDGGLFTPRLFSLTGQDKNGDEDGDGILDSKDTFPGLPDEWVDHDGDGIGDNADPDDDNDGMSDNYELLCGLNPFQPDANGDADGDGMSNGKEALAGTLANDPTSLFALSIGIYKGKPNMVSVPMLTTRVYSIQTATSPAGPWQTVLSGERPSVATIYHLQISGTSSVFARAIADYP